MGSEDKSEADRKESSPARPCQYFTLGCCKYDRGEECSFSHDRSICVPGYFKEPCSHFLASYCRNGKYCLYLHDVEYRDQHRTRAEPPESVKSVYNVSSPGFKDSTSSEVRSLRVQQDQQQENQIQEMVGELSQQAFNLKLSEDQVTYYYGSTSPDANISKGSGSNSAAAWRQFTMKHQVAGTGAGTELKKDPIESDVEVCKYFLSGSCKFGSTCRFQHPTCHESVDDQNQAWERAASCSLECGICLDIVYNKQDSRFGVLPGCDHVFCLECIRSWRSAGVSDTQREAGLPRSCPSCRKISNFVIPSAIFPSGAERKSELIDRYLGGLGRQDCKYYKRGSGTCPFGNSCFYLHRDELGRIEPAQSLRIVKDETGHTVHTTQARVSDYLTHYKNRGS